MSWVIGTSLSTTGPTCCRPGPGQWARLPRDKSELQGDLSRVRWAQEPRFLVPAPILPS